MALSDAAGATTASFAYEPYGAATKTGTADTAFRFTGREDDGATGLQYFRSRYYSAELGRFISSDPIGLAGGANTYAYVNGDPAGANDPLGLALTSVDWACAKDPMFCAEIMGQMVRSNAAVRGDPCAIEAADALSGAMMTMATVATVATIVSAVPSGARAIAGVPGRVLSRINVSNSGWAHVVGRHFGGTGSQFSIAQSELRALLGSKGCRLSCPTNSRRARRYTIPASNRDGSSDGCRQIHRGKHVDVDRYYGWIRKPRYDLSRDSAMTRHSSSDQQIAEDLQRGREALLTEESSRSLLATLRQLLQSITPNLYILKWVPEQNEDLYDILVDGTTVARVEIPRARGDGRTMCRTSTVEEYMREQRGMTKLERRKLEVALNLAASNKP